MREDIICTTALIIFLILLIILQGIILLSNYMKIEKQDLKEDLKEECESCKEEMTSEGIKYKCEYYIENQVKYCKHCGLPI